MRVITSRIFGLLDYERGHVRLTELGIRAVDAKYARAARVESFLAVPLFKAVFDKFKGSPLPPMATIERIMEQLGVAPKQKGKARQVFMRSAKQAGFFQLDSERLTIPPNSIAATPDQIKQPDTQAPVEMEQRRGGGAGGGPPDDLHPFIEGLLRTLPPPESKWPTAGRTKWLQAAANIFDLIYAPNDDPERGEVKITVEKR